MIGQWMRGHVAILVLLQRKIVIIPIVPQLLKPLVDGPQMAHVVGPAGEEIYTDNHGRVKVHLPWNRHKKAGTEDSSCWIRVASNWAGCVGGILPFRALVRR